MSLQKLTDGLLKAARSGDAVTQAKRMATAIAKYVDELVADIAVPIAHPPTDPKPPKPAKPAAKKSSAKKPAPKKVVGKVSSQR